MENETKRIYRLNDREDAFVIVDLEKPNPSYCSRELPIAFFRALITRRDDIYPLECLPSPDFLLIS
ncbi:hypothetical protein PSTEL_04385 [Paenibacillus stellifer]|uniref:Uncharacterized protein n=1 Tax=Paenibacillus stellifer TaxID=169760 RepID=A0A089N1C3_9BACL|nr:hypothetical protein [Paenibacillus stellifer]AIQ62459.1 hypothetical protein PSTEL_04385 [Paenibacillus stellifer]